MKFVDLLDKDAKSLSQLCTDLKKQLMNLRFSMKSSQEFKPSVIRMCKKDIARIKTRLTQLQNKK